MDISELNYNCCAASCCHGFWTVASSFFFVFELIGFAVRTVLTCVDDFVFDCAILNNMGFACREGRARDN